MENNKCGYCKKNIIGDGNNSWFVKERICDLCNSSIEINKRIKWMEGNKDD